MTPPMSATPGMTREALDFMADQLARLEQAHWDRINAEYEARVFKRSEGWLPVREAIERAKAGMSPYLSKEEMQDATRRESGSKGGS